MFAFLKRKNKISSELKEAWRAKRLIKRLFRLRIIKFLLIALVLLIATPVALIYLYQPKIQDNINYGVNFSNKYATQMDLDWKATYLAILDELNVKNIRIAAYWDDIEVSKGKYNFDDIVWQLNEAEKRNVNVIMTIGRKVPRYPECFEPQWWKITDNEEIQILHELEYVKALVTRIKNYKSIKMWQVENEPFFKFGECVPDMKKSTVKSEVEIVKSLDNRPIIIQDSGEGGFWLPSYQLGNYLGISMYRKVWYKPWHSFYGSFFYFKYPFAYWTYKIKAELTLVPHNKIVVTELQAEPWGPGINSKLTEHEKNQTMSRHDFLDTIAYAQKSGFKDLYFWGAEWWYWEKIKGNSFYWDTAKALFH